MQMYENKYGQNEDGFLTAYRLTGESKLQGVAEFLDTLIENNCKFLIYAHHESVVNGIEEILRKRRIIYVRMTSSTDIQERVAMVDAF